MSIMLAGKERGERLREKSGYGSGSYYDVRMREEAKHGNFLI